MKCCIPGPNVKVFAKVILSFARISPELFIEANEDGLSIRCVNSTKSAFAMVRFQPQFFLEYIVNRKSRRRRTTTTTSSSLSSDTTNCEFENECKVLTKSFVGVFKNINKVEQCLLNLNANDYKLMITLECKLETIKTHTISILEHERLDAVYVKENAPNTLSASTRLFADVVNNFHSNDEEITFEAKKQEAIVKNYQDGNVIDSRYVRSQVTLQKSEFDLYQITQETGITFCLRELRSMLNLAEALSLDISMNFEDSGKPVVFVMKSLQILEANLVMSTLEPDADDDDDAAAAESNSENRIRVGAKRSIAILSLDSDRTLSNDSMFAFDKNTNFTKSIPTVVGSEKTNSVQIEPSKNSVVAIEKTNSEQIEPSKNTDSEEIRIIFRDTASEPMEINEDNENGRPDESIPKSPEVIKMRRKVRNIFQRCIDRDIESNSKSTRENILAENSDTDS